MPLLLDTFNVLHTVGVLPPDLAGIDITGLAGLIGLSRYRGERVTFVCDGLPHAGLPAQGRLQIAEGPGAELDLTVRYSGTTAPADDLIQDLVNASTAPRRVIVVSSDHMVQRHARRRRCTVLSSQEFLQQLADDARLPRPSRAPDKPIPRGMPDEQIEKWMRAFGVDEQTAALPTGLDDDLVSDDGESQLHGPTADAVPGPASPANHTPSEPRAHLSADLIAEAELLWQRAQPARPPKPLADTPPANTTAPSSPAAASASAASPKSLDAAEALDASGDSHDIDMNDILPPDGRTQPLQRRHNRHRPQ